MKYLFFNEISNTFACVFPHPFPGNLLIYDSEPKVRRVPSSTDDDETKRDPPRGANQHHPAKSQHARSSHRRRRPISQHEAATLTPKNSISYKEVPDRVNKSAAVEEEAEERDDEDHDYINLNVLREQIRAQPAELGLFPNVIG